MKDDRIFRNMQALEFTFDTIPGLTAYTSGETPMHSALFIIIVTEGSREEIEYIRYVQQLLKEKEVTTFEVVVLNDFVANRKARISASNPMQRLNLMLDWKHKNLNVSEADVQDEDWLICDRDDDSFKERQYDKILRITERDGIHFIVSNPAFQLWLLFHFEGNLNRLNLHTYSSSREQLTVVENELKNHVPDYEHGSLDMNKFAPYIRNAIVNSQNYTMDIRELKTHVGSNFSDLLLDIQTKSGMDLY